VPWAEPDSGVGTNRIVTRAGLRFNFSRVILPPPLSVVGGHEESAEAHRHYLHFSYSLAVLFWILEPTLSPPQLHNEVNFARTWLLDNQLLRRFPATPAKMSDAQASEAEKNVRPLPNNLLRAKED
jgi:hypothetical protein